MVNILIYSLELILRILYALVQFELMSISNSRLGLVAQKVGSFQLDTIAYAKVETVHFNSNSNFAVGIQCHKSENVALWEVNWERN